jgi:hypothetical protein
MKGRVKVILTVEDTTQKLSKLMTVSIQGKLEDSLDLEQAQTSALFQFGSQIGLLTDRGMILSKI